MQAQFLHLKKLAKCHIQAFPASLSSRLGLKFCVKMQEWFIVDERGLLLYVTDERGEIVGYLSGIKALVPGNPGSFSSVSSYAFKTFVWSFVKKPWLLFSPEIMENRKTIFTIIRKKFKLKKNSPPSNTHSNVKFIPFLGIAGIGVLPAYRGQGYASKLLREFEDVARNYGITKLILSVECGNKQAVKSYLRNGFDTTKISGNLLHMEKILS